MKKRVELVGELERLAERFWGDDYVKAASFGEAAKVYGLLADANAERLDSEIRKDKLELAALVADGAGKARRRAVSPVGPFAVDEDAAGADGDAGEPSSEVRRTLKGGQAFLLRLEFAFEFANLVRAFFGVAARGGEVVLECGDFAAAKERAEALKRLAAWIDDFEDGKEVGDAHATIIAYWLASLRPLKALKGAIEYGSERNDRMNAKNENENEKRGEAAAKQDPRGDGAKYTRLRSREVMDIIQDAADSGFRDIDLAERVREEAKIEESEDNPGTWFIEFHAKTWREAAAFSAAIVGMAFLCGFYADVSADWNIGLECEDGGRLVDVFVAASDFMTDDGKPVVG